MTDRRKKPLPQYAPPYTAPYAVPLAYPQPPAFKEPPRASVSVLRDKNATVANVTVSQMTDYSRGPDYTFEASGSTKREQGDRYDPQTGDLMAIGRALRSAGNAMISEANHRVQEIIADQAQERRRAAERRENKGKPVNRRTREEWEALQRRSQAAQNAVLAKALGLDVEQDFSVVSSVAKVSKAEEWGGAAFRRESEVPARQPVVYNVKDGRTLEVEDDRIVIRDSNGYVVTMIDRV